MTERPLDILLVEDNPDDLELTLHALRENRLVNRIEVARDGQAALDYLYGNGEYAGRDLTEKPRMVLLDLKLPKVNGLEVLREIKRNESTRAIPVVVLTSSREDRDVVDSYNLGVNSYIQKPVSFSEFTEAVSQLGMYWMLLNAGPGR